MASKSEKDKTKQLQDKCQTVLTDLLRDEDNKYCVDCDSKGPRWASWNLGVFLCIRCAGIHRNLGVHISKVKSVNLDAWTPEQVVSLQQMGNSRARAVYEANIPDNFRRPQNDASLETFIRAKYEHKKYIAKEWVPPSLPKVNWEKEIEEEIERQKRKKKTILEKKSLGIVEVPQLPKPKNASPKPTRSATNQPTEDKQVTDLLALQNGEDGFSNFLSAPPKEEVKEMEKEPKDNGKSEEESFFNQPAPTEKEKAKMTKDSILALYGNAPPINNFMPQYTNFPAQQNFQNYNFPGQQTFQNGAQPPQQQFTNHQFPAQFPPQTQFNQFGPQTQPIQQQQQQLPIGNQFQNQQFQQHGQFQTVPGQFNPMMYQQQNFGAKPAVPNPFFGNQTGIQQQFSNLSLSNSQSNNPAPGLATNIWQ